MSRKYTLLSAFGIALLAVNLVSCHKFEGSQKVPSYIRIDSISVDPQTDYFTFGANTHKITDAWVHVDDQLIGVYELPATFPVLKKGRHKVAIYGGIMVDGRSPARDRYPFYKPVIFQDVNLVEDSIVKLNPVVNYYPIGEGTNVAWIEDFENANTMMSDATSDTSLFRISGSEAWHSSNSFWSGKVELPSDSLDFCISTIEEFEFYKDMDGVYCLLEMDYNCNDTFFVGMQYYSDYELVSRPLVKITPTDKNHEKPQKWNKIYINIGPKINEDDKISYFKIYFTSDLTTKYDLGYHPINEPRYYYFDNLKLLYRKL